MSSIKDKQEESYKKLETEKSELIPVYAIKIGYNEFYTDDKEVAISIWESFCSKFFTIQTLTSPSKNFEYRKPVLSELVGKKRVLWKSEDSAKSAQNVYNQLNKRPKSKDYDDRGKDN